MDKKINRKEIYESTTVEIPITNVNTQLYAFPQNEDLRDATAITGMEIIPLALQTKSPANRNVINAGAFAAGYVTLQDQNGTTHIQQQPFAVFNPQNNYGEFKQLNIPPINPTQCNIYIADASTLVENESVIVTIYFLRKGRVING